MLSQMTGEWYRRILLHPTVIPYSISTSIRMYPPQSSKHVVQPSPDYSDTKPFVASISTPSDTSPTDRSMQPQCHQCFITCPMEVCIVLHCVTLCYIALLLCYIVLLSLCFVSGSCHIKHKKKNLLCLSSPCIVRLALPMNRSVASILPSEYRHMQHMFDVCPQHRSSSPSSSSSAMFCRYV